MTLADAPVGQRVQIISILDAQPITQRLREMGMVVGEVVVVERVAPLGDPLQLLIKDYSLAIRHKEAACFEVIVCQ